MIIAFRVDDIYKDGSDFEFKLLALFQKYLIPLTLAVIPFNKEGQPIVYCESPVFVYSVAAELPKSKALWHPTITKPDGVRYTCFG
jgi:hypothetical protein